jgi:hypothetical protein
MSKVFILCVLQGLFETINSTTGMDPRNKLRCQLSDYLVLYMGFRRMFPEHIVKRILLFIATWTGSLAFPSFRMGVQPTWSGCSWGGWNAYDYKVCGWLEGWCAYYRIPTCICVFCRHYIPKWKKPWGREATAQQEEVKRVFLQ